MTVRTTGLYRADPAILDLQKGRAGPYFDAVQAAAFPDHILRFRNDEWAARIGLGDLSDADWIKHFGAFAPLDDNLPKPLALRYHGHQFRSYNPDIGDGRGFLYAQMRDGDGRLLDLGTKGSGKTPYSRFGDGRLTLKGAVREILATEMLEALGVYTSKTFSVIETGEALERHDEPSPTRSAVMVRLGHSHIRFGAFQRLAFEKNASAISRLVDYCVEHFDPDLANEPAKEKTAAFFDRVVTRTARLAAQWMAAGFVHGVLNTDNMNVTGESFDYGPWRFIPHVDFSFTAAYFDETGLYAYGRQPEAAAWNLSRLGGILSLLTEIDDLNESLGDFHPRFKKSLDAAFCKRLGVDTPKTDPGAFAFGCLKWLEKTGLPFEDFFFDWFGGGESEERTKIHHSVYGEEDFSSVKETLLGLKPVRPERAQHAFFQRQAPQTILIEEVEEIWDAIADNDDWAPLNHKIRAIREMGDAYDIRATAQTDGILGESE
ncbi:MAG: YdiU family protein [Pseudomonadota bacterium]